MWIRVALLTGVLTALVGCGFSFSADEPTIEGTQWRAVVVDGEAPVEGSAPTLRLGPENVSGWTGCNGYGSGPIEIGPGSFETGMPLEIGELSVDQASCPDADLARIQQNFLDNLAAVTQFRLEEGSLIFEGPDGRIRFEQVQVDQ